MAKRKYKSRANTVTAGVSTQVADHYKTVQRRCLRCGESFQMRKTEWFCDECRTKNIAVVKTLGRTVLRGERNSRGHHRKVHLSAKD